MFICQPGGPYWEKLCQKSRVWLERVIPRDTIFQRFQGVTFFSTRSLWVLSIGKSTFQPDLRFSNRKQNPKTDFATDFVKWISINKISFAKSVFGFSIGNPNFRISISKSGFSNRKHPMTKGFLPKKVIKVEKTSKSHQSTK